MRVPVRGPVAVGVKSHLYKAGGGVGEGSAAGLAAGRGRAEGKVAGEGGWSNGEGGAVGAEIGESEEAGPLELWTGTGPKFCAAGVRRRPVSGRPVPVRRGRKAFRRESEERVRVPVWGPATVGWKRMPRQQL